MVRNATKLFVTSLVLCAMTTGCTTTTPAVISLFDGESLNGWSATDESKWWVMDGAITLQSGEDGYLVTDSTFENVTLEVEFWVDSQVNSGVFVNCSDPTDISPVSCYEINIWDDHPGQEYRTGAIVTQVPPRMKMNTAGQWNQFEISVSSRALVVELNGSEISRINRPEKQRGHIALQRSNGGEVRFRNLSLSSN